MIAQAGTMLGVTLSHTASERRTLDKFAALLGGESEQSLANKGKHPHVGIGHSGHASI